MMISPENYIDMIKNNSYYNLLKERDCLIREIRRFEKDKDKSSKELMMEPSPEVQYQMNLQYLAKLCQLISETYNRDSVCECKDEIQSDYSSFLENLQRLHTTELGAQRIRDNLSLVEEDIVKWCKDKINQENASVVRQGKNWYVRVDDYEITINATSFTIITAHKKKK